MPVQVLIIIVKLWRALELQTIPRLLTTAGQNLEMETRVRLDPYGSQGSQVRSDHNLSDMSDYFKVRMNVLELDP